MREKEMEIISYEAAPRRYPAVCPNNLEGPGNAGHLGQSFLLQHTRVLLSALPMT